MNIPFTIKQLGIHVDYQTTWAQMKDFTEQRIGTTPDEFWVLEHDPVYTLGLAGKEEHFLQKTNNIPIIRTDRGGQVTYHGPGQIVIYVLVDLKRAGLSIRSLVERLEQGIISYLESIGVQANGNRDAPGVYVNGRKIASLGLKVRKGCTYHGISFNYDMDCMPFNAINVCGYSGLKVVQLTDIVTADENAIKSELTRFIIENIYEKRS
ncbi:MAG: octanoyltransferase [Burkholderiales bacterium]|jgi:lipoyl(octanoyl) transferase|nr:octanoyltransferase [Burkholderiales bacterium]